MIDPEEMLTGIEMAGLDQQTTAALLELLESVEWRREAGKAYPPQYAVSRAYRPPEQAQQQLRRRLRRFPRVRPDRYEILFNLEGADFTFDGPSWDIVKWVRFPEAMGLLIGKGCMTVVVYEPFVIHSIPGNRSPLSITDAEVIELMRNSVTLRSSQEIDEKMKQTNLKRLEDERARQADEALAFAEYYRNLFRRAAEEMGI